MRQAGITAPEIMADWTGLPEPGELPGEFTVDYVRVWQP